MGGAKAHYDSIKAFSETDQTEDEASTVPALVLHSEDDQDPYRSPMLQGSRSSF